MNTEVIIDHVIPIEELSEKNLTDENSEVTQIKPDLTSPAKRRFGIADLWKIRSTRRHFIFYR